MIVSGSDNSTNSGRGVTRDRIGSTNNVISMTIIIITLVIVMIIIVIFIF